MFFLAEEMSDDETMTLAVCGIGAFIGMCHWYATFLRGSPLTHRSSARSLLLFCPPVCFGILLPALMFFSAVEVRTDFRYVFLFLFVGGAWLTVLRYLLPWLNLHPSVDVVENNNVAAAVAIAGAMLGVTLVFTGANMGEGPTIWTTIGPALAATLLYLFAWSLSEWLGGTNEAITVDHDHAAAARFAGLAIANGLIIGRAVAGDWETQSGMLRDLWAGGWPALALAVATSFINRRLDPRANHPRPSTIAAGVMPAAVYLAIAVAWVVSHGDWRGER